MSCGTGETHEGGAHNYTDGKRRDETRLQNKSRKTQKQRQTTEVDGLQHSLGLRQKKYLRNVGDISLINTHKRWLFQITYQLRDWTAPPMKQTHETEERKDEIVSVRYYGPAAVL